MAIKFSQFNLRTDHTSGMYLVGYDGNQNIHITVDNLFDDFINGTENTIAMFGTDGTVLADSILSQDAGATLLTVAGQLNVDAAATFDTSITVTGDSTLNGNVTLGDASTDLITQNGTLYLNGPVKDTTDTLGAVDQVLLSDATGELTFTDLADLHVGGAEVVEVPVKNVQGSALVKGDPVYISGSVGASGRLEVQLADASNTLKMPAVGLLKQDLADNAEGFAVVTGKLRNLITDPIDGVNPTENDVIYVKPLGTSGAALTTTKPVYGNFIQNVGKVGRVSTSNDGNFVVSSILRTNDIPNLTPGRLWIGSTGNTIESQTLFVDEASGRLGIGTTTPDQDLTINGGTESFGLQVSESDRMTMGADADWNYIKGKNGNGFRFSTFGAGDVLTLTNAGDVGIGAVTPSAKLEIEGDGSIIKTTRGAFSITTSMTSGNHSILSNGKGFSVGTSDANNLSLDTNNSSRLLIDSSGNVGIGTTSPSTKLEISTSMSSSPSSNIFLNVDGSNTTGGGGSIIFGTSATAGTASDYNAKITGTRAAGGAGGDSELGFWTTLVSDSISPQQRMTITKEGNVGIGTTSPNAKLEVLGGTGKQLRLSTGTTTYWELGRSTSTGHFEITEDSGDTYFLIDKDTGQIQFNEYGSGAFTGTATKTLAVDASGNIIETAGVSVDGSGTANYVTKWFDTDTITDSVIYDDGTNVGIGTTSPTHLLHVAGSVNIEDDLTFGIGGFLGTSSVDFTMFSLGDLIYNADSNNNGNSNHIFKESGNELMRIDSSGNVGIGTTSPFTNLTVYGATDSRIALVNASTGNTSADGFVLIAESDRDVHFLNRESSDMFFSTDGSKRITILSGGNVGIGTTSPARPLHVNGAGTNFVAEFQSTDDKASILIQDDDTLNYIHSQDGYLSLGGQNALSANNLNINSSSGNVGIGTASPSQKLHVNSGVTNTVAIFESTDTEAQVNFVDTTGTSSIRTRNDFRFNSGNTELVRFESGGNVGIGTTSPTSPLTVKSNSTSAADSGITIQANANTNPLIKLAEKAGDKARFHMYNAGVEKIAFYTDGTDNHISAGNLGIGTTSPASKFHVYNNDAKISSDAGITVEQDGTGDAVVQYLLTGTKRWVTGIDNSDGDKFKISHNIDLSTDNVATFTDDNRVGIGTTSPASTLDVNGGIRMADDSSTASASNVGTLRYRTSGNNSYVDMCMQTGASTYAWVNIVQNNW